MDASFFQSKDILEKINDFGCVALENESDWITQGPNPKFIDNDGIPSLTGRNIARGFVSPEGADQVSASEFKELNRFRILAGDIFITLKGAGSTGKVALLNDPFKGIFSRNIGLIRLNKASKLTPEFIFAYLRSGIGQKLIDRGVTGATGQLTLPTEYLKNLPIPKPSERLILAVSSIVSKAYDALQYTQKVFHDSERKLLNALKIAEWSADETTTFEANFNETKKSNRLDPEHFHPRWDELIETAKKNATYVKTISEISIKCDRGTQPVYADNDTCDRVSIINSKHILNGMLDYANFEMAPESWFWGSKNAQNAIVSENDILTYTTGANIGRTAAYLSSEKAIASNHVNIIRLENENPLFVAFLLNSIVGRFQTEKWKSGSAQPELYSRDILEFFVPFPNIEIQGEIADSIIEAELSRKQSYFLLDRAKRAVEIAIEQDEATALAYLDGKHYVADELLPKLFGLSRHYVDLDSIQKTIEAEAILYESATIKRYLQEWQHEGRIFNAGREWYSDLREEYQSTLDQPVIKSTLELVEKSFPLLDYTIWSTRELTPYFHHLPNRHVTYLMVDRDALEPVADALLDAGQIVAVHPLGEVAKSFRLNNEDTIILRPRLSTDHTAKRPPIEQVLVDLHFEIQKLGLFEGEEFERLVRNLSSTRRINITALKRYAERRKIDPAEILGFVI